MALNSNTILFAVIGDPVSHSLGPLMHNTAFSELGYNGAYLAFQVKDIGKAVVGIKALGIKGASITIPHKISVKDPSSENGRRHRMPDNRCRFYVCIPGGFPVGIVDRNESTC